MAGPYHGTCAFIPPPPLPEFYTTTKKEGTSTSSSSIIEVESKIVSIKEPVVSVDGAYDGRPTAPTMPRRPSAPWMTIPRLPPTANAREVPPLAIYHICRLCLRPRSPRYHKEHPIPINGLPPPPGICRRCRVTSVDETKRIAEIVTKSESNKIKIGFIQPFVADEDIISNKEMKQINAEKYLRSLTTEHTTAQSRDRSSKDIVYRHVRIVEEPDDSPIEKKTKVTFTTDAPESSEDEPLAQLRAPHTTNTSMQVQPTENPPSMPAKTVNSVVLRKGDTSTASTTTKRSSSTSSTAKPAVKTSTQAAKPREPECTRSDIHQIAREEIERYRNAYWQTERMDSRIRELARQEVEHYRQAERKLEAHPDPYAHGRLVPVERRIDTERDVAKPMPWVKVTKDEKVSVTSKVASRTPIKEQSVATPKHSSSTSTTSSTSTSKPSEVESRARATVQQREERRPKRDDKDHSGDYAQVRTAAVTLEKGDKHDKKDPTLPERNESSKSLPTQSHKPASTDRPKQEVEIRRYLVQQRNAIPKQPPARQEEQPWSSSGKSIQRENTYDESVVKTIDTRSSRQYEMSGSGGTLPTNVSKSFQSMDDRTKSRASRTESTRGREMVYVPAEQDTLRSNPESRPRPRDKPPYPEHDVFPARVVRPAETVTEQSSRNGLPKSSRSTKDSNTEYLYAERTVQPAWRPLGRRPFDDHPPARHVEIEEILEWTRDPVDQSKPRKPESHRKRERSPPARPSETRPSGRDKPKSYDEKTAYYERSTGRSQGNGPFDKDIAVVTSAHEDDSIPPRRTVRMEAYGEVNPSQREKSPTEKRQRENPGKQDPRVQFSSKVDVSPTPPGSDASSSEIRRFHLGKGGSRQLDGSHSPDRFQDLVDEYESRGRMRDRESRAGDEDYEEREAIRERRSDRETTFNSKRKGEREYNSGGGRPLARALSESPSRESLSLLGIETMKSDQNQFEAKQEKTGSKREKADASHDKTKSTREKLDGRGPYRAPEKVTDSMRVEDGSPGGRYWDQREESVYRRWKDV